MDHPNIVKAHEVFLCSDQIYLVLELCSGSDLYTKSPYTEKQAARIMSQMCSALVYMHEHKIVHRDLKFENIMFQTKSSIDIKIIDFVSLVHGHNPIFQRSLKLRLTHMLFDLGIVQKVLGQNWCDDRQSWHDVRTEFV